MAYRIKMVKWWTVPSIFTSAGKWAKAAPRHAPSRLTHPGLPHAPRAATSSDQAPALAGSRYANALSVRRDNPQNCLAFVLA